MPPTRRAVLALSNALVAGTLLPGCLAPLSGGSGESVPTVTADEDPNPVASNERMVRALARGNAEFGLALLSKLAEDDPGGNQFLSPYSVSVALAMTYAGARGETRTQMADTLRFGLEDESLHAAFGGVADRLAASGEADDETNSEADVPFRLNVANAVWGQRDYPWRDGFLTTLRTYYDAGVHALDFADDHEAASETIDDWVADRTEGKISELFPEGALSRRTRLVLTDAIHFRATWAEPFEEDRTTRQPFTALDGTSSRVPTMEQSDRFPYASVDGQQVIELPYVGDEVGMVVVLPERGTFGEFTRSLDADRVAALTGALERREGTISLPKFTVESGFDLSGTLSDLGMPVAFSDAADFGGMVDPAETDERLRIDDVRHESYIAVDEEGTEAAAATGVEMTPVSAPRNPFEMSVDRPFLFLIRHRPTDTVLFLGRVVDASAARPD